MIEIDADMREVEARRPDPLAELVLYISQQFEEGEKFGQTKLNKILFWSDFIRYGRAGEPITNQDYQREDFGPINRAAKPVQDKLEDSGDLERRRERVGDEEQERPVALREPNLEMFSAPEKEIVDEVIEALRDVSAREASELSHRFAGWRATPEGEPIPYETVFVSNRELTDAERHYARELVDDDG